MQLGTCERLRLFCLLLLVSAMAGCGPQTTPQQRLDAYVTSEQNSLPKAVDEVTTLVELQSKPLEIVYVYQIESLDDEAITASRDAIQQSVQQGLQQEKDKLQQLARDRIKMTYVYQGESKNDLIRFTVNPWEL